MKNKRYVARTEPFGMTIHDSGTSQLFMLRGIGEVEGLKLILRNITGDHEARWEDIDFKKIDIRRDDILSAPQYVEIYPTMACNERCRFCYVGGNLSASPEKNMQRGTIDRIADQLGRNGNFVVSVLGGEPFLYKDLSYLLKSMNEANQCISVSTNGTVLNRKIFAEMQEMDITTNLSFHSHIPEVQDTITRLKGSFRRAYRTLDYLRSMGYPPHVSVVANSMNVGHIVETVEFMCKNGARAVSLFHTMREGFAKSDEMGISFEEYARAYQESRKVGEAYGVSIMVVTNFPFLANKRLVFDTKLGALANMFYGTIDGRSALYINYDGGIFPTSYRLGSEELLMGNINTDDIHVLWNESPVIEQFRKATPPEGCGECGHFTYCRGGPIINYAPTVLRMNHKEGISCPLVEEETSE